jgi:hypothetical protein
MKAFIYSHQHFIGEANLAPGDVSMGHVYGIFESNEYYFFSIQKSVQQLNGNIKTNYNSWLSLELNIQLENGYFLHPAGGCTINDWEDCPDDPITIDIMGLDHSTITDYVNNEQSTAFMKAPWEVIDITQKLRYEKQLKEALSTNENSSQQHLLTHISISALCADTRSDDVLFSVIGLPQHNFALVHLTWNNNINPTDKYPHTVLFETYADFKREVIDPDSVM